MATAAQAAPKARMAPAAAAASAPLFVGDDPPTPKENGGSSQMREAHSANWIRVRTPSRGRSGGFLMEGGAPSQWEIPPSACARSSPTWVRGQIIQDNNPDAAGGESKAHELRAHAGGEQPCELGALERARVRTPSPENTWAAKTGCNVPLPLPSFDTMLLPRVAQHVHQPYLWVIPLSVMAAPGWNTSPCNSSDRSLGSGAPDAQVDADAGCSAPDARAAGRAEMKEATATRDAEVHRRRAFEELHAEAFEFEELHAEDSQSPLRAVGAGQGSAGAATAPPAPWSQGSAGHPTSCPAPCKYVRKARGCKEGEDCERCHLCVYRAPKRASGTFVRRARNARARSGGSAEVVQVADSV